jgi:hypothetical protein
MLDPFLHFRKPFSQKPRRASFDEALRFNDFSQRVHPLSNWSANTMNLAASGARSTGGPRQPLRFRVTCFPAVILRLSEAARPFTY